MPVGFFGFPNMSPYSRRHMHHYHGCCHRHDYYRDDRFRRDNDMYRDDDRYGRNRRDDFHY